MPEQDLVYMLLSGGADPNAKAHESAKSPFETSVSAGASEITTLLQKTIGILYFSLGFHLQIT